MTTPAEQYVSALKESAAFLDRNFGKAPEIAIVLGSGLGGFVDLLKNQKALCYSDIPNFPLSTVVGHSGKLIVGDIGSKRVAVMAGRCHLYEGYSASKITIPLRALGKWGVSKFLLTNACGGLSSKFTPGDIVSLNNIITLFYENPSIGVNHPELGDFFYDMTSPFDAEMRALIIEEAKKLGIRIQEGVYCGLKGPAYETAADIQTLQKLGAELVGMSTVAEVLAARQMKLKVACLSVVTNLAAGISPTLLSHQEVIDTGKQAADKLKSILSACIERI